MDVPDESMTASLDADEELGATAVCITANRPSVSAHLDAVAWWALGVCMVEELLGASRRGSAGDRPVGLARRIDVRRQDQRHLRARGDGARAGEALRGSGQAGRDDAGVRGLRAAPSGEGESRYFVYTRWADEESFQGWVQSQAFGQGHAQAEGPRPVAQHADLLAFEVVDLG